MLKDQKISKLLAGLLLLLSISISLKAQEKIPLYSGSAFPFSGIDARIPTLSCYTPQGKATGTAVIICSGGSYGGLADAQEGIPACKKLAAAGITAFLLDYRLPHGHDSIPFADAQAALRYLRTTAAKYHLRKDRIGIMGFSAGGHLAATITTHFKESFDGGAPDGNIRPDFSVLVYPVISMTDELTHKGSQQNLLGNAPTEADKLRFSNEQQVTDQTPPVFIVHAVDDNTVNVGNTLYFAAALRQHKVPVEMFVYAQGGHGFGVQNGTAQIQWIDPCIEWIKVQVKKS